MKKMIEKMRVKALLALAPALVIAGFALPSAAMAEAEPCTNNILCDNAGNALRDDLAEPPLSGNYGADIMAVNTEGPLRLLGEKEGKVVAANSNPKGYAFFGVELESNPTTGSCAAGHRFAKGHVTFADIQNAELTEPVEVPSSPVYSGISPGGFGPWEVEIASDSCAGGAGEPAAGEVVVHNVHLFFPVLGATATGTFLGTYVQPGAGCEGGGIKLDVEQPEVTVTGAETAEVDNGEAGKNAFLCFVSSNNVLYPETAPTWSPLHGAIWKD
jgi:hypothetical protein